MKGVGLFDYDYNYENKYFYKYLAGVKTLYIVCFDLLRRLYNCYKM